MLLKNKKFTKGISVCLVVALTMGSFVLFKKNTKAASINENEVVNNANYKDFVQEFRKNGVDITITSLNDLYNEFDNYTNIDEIVRENILAKTADEVIVQFLLAENKEFFDITEKEEVNATIFSESQEEKYDNNYIKNVESKYYIKGDDSYKTKTVITNKYGGRFEIICIDEPEDQTRGIGKYTPVKDFKPYKETWFKDYGDRKFSFTYGIPHILTQTATLGYKLDYGRIETRYIKGEVNNIISPIAKATLESSTITKSVSENIGEKVAGEAIFVGTAYGGLYGGADISHVKMTISIEQGADANHPTKCGMYHIIRANVYSKYL